MGRAEDNLARALCSLPPKPGDGAAASAKKGYSEQMSNVVANALAQELRDRGMVEALPAPQGTRGRSGAERRLAGGLGAKKVDVSWATEESGLIFAVSVKTINFRDGRAGSFQKNLTNRRADLLMEATTLHRRFPYAILAAILFLDHGAEHDDTPRRSSTFHNAFPRLRLFSGRDDPAGRDEQYERLYLALVDATPTGSTVRLYDAAGDGTETSLTQALDDLIDTVAERNFDDYENDGVGNIRKI